MGSCPAARKVNGGKGSIAEQMVDNGFDVVLGVAVPASRRTWTPAARC